MMTMKLRQIQRLSKGIQIANKSFVVDQLKLIGIIEGPTRSCLEERWYPETYVVVSSMIAMTSKRTISESVWLTFYMTAHFSLSLIALLLCTGCNDTERFFSRVSKSRNRASTLWFVLADVSKKPQPQLAASAAPSLIETSRTDGLSSHLFPTWM